MKSDRISKSQKVDSLTLESLESRTLLSRFSWLTADDVGNSIKTAHNLDLDANGDTLYDALIDHSRDQDVFSLSKYNCLK